MTWEPLSSLQNCLEIVNDFEKDHRNSSFDSASKYGKKTNFKVYDLNVPKKRPRKNKDTQKSTKKVCNRFKKVKGLRGLSSLIVRSGNLDQDIPAKIIAATKIDGKIHFAVSFKHQNGFTPSVSVISYDIVCQKAGHLLLNHFNL